MHIKGIKLQAIDIHNLCYMFRRIFAVFRETIILRNLQKNVKLTSQNSHAMLYSMYLLSYL